VPIGVRSAADRADGRHPYHRVGVHRSAVAVFVSKMKGGYLTALFTAIMSTVILLATLLHAVESAIWAASDQPLGAQPDCKSAMLFLFGAMTTFGNAMSREAHWLQMRGKEKDCVF
jgi:hypothetical protein